MFKVAETDKRGTIIRILPHAFQSYANADAQAYWLTNNDGGLFTVIGTGH